MKHYPIFWSDEDEAFIAIAPDLPGCSAAGATEEEALKELRIAMRLWLKVCEKAAIRFRNLLGR